MSIQQDKKVNRFKQFHKWLKGYYKLYFVAIILLIVLQYFRTLLPLFFQYIINTVLGDETSELPQFMQDLTMTNDIKTTLMYVGLLYIGFALFRVMLMFFRRLSIGMFMEKVAYRMRNTLYSTLQNLTFSYHSKAETGDLIQRCTTDVETFRVFVGEQLIEIFRLVFLVGFSIYQMARINPMMMLYSVMVTPVIFTAAFIYFINVKSVFK
jgi:ATP-binding cassette subfamily B protein